MEREVSGGECEMKKTECGIQCDDTQHTPAIRRMQSSAICLYIGDAAVSSRTRSIVVVFSENVCSVCFAKR